MFSNGEAHRQAVPADANSDSDHHRCPGRVSRRRTGIRAPLRPFTLRRQDPLSQVLHHWKTGTSDSLWISLGTASTSHGRAQTPRSRAFVSGQRYQALLEDPVDRHPPKLEQLRSHRRLAESAGHRHALQESGWPLHLRFYRCKVCCIPVQSTKRETSSHHVASTRDFPRREVRH